FIDGGADAERTVAANERAYAQRTIVPRYLVDVSNRDLGCELFGHQLAMPLLIAPTGLARIAHPAGEIAGARAARSAGVGFVVSSASSDSLERVASEAGGLLWFQLYLWPDRAIVEQFVQRAASAGYGALVVTVDVPVIGNRLRDVRNGFSIPPRLSASTVADVLRHPRWLAGMRQRLRFGNVEDLVAPGAGSMEYARFVNRMLANPAADWATFDWIRAAWEGPLLVKGVLSTEDARRAVDHGADGLIVSNHGGRQLDDAPASLDVLPAIVEAAPTVPVLVDGGVRRGSDMLKALALGARACLIGRPWLYGLAAAGERGVTGVLDVLRAELDRTLALSGVPGVGSLTPEAVGYGGPGRAS
ncbi:MAG: alpha-hydroxy-acid oxidizing protein, partial [Actinobacteria bacterium]|nr:alpha-hydroxy-acid oxidizing protein [Actinomycetota bacterium]